MQTEPEKKRRQFPNFSCLTRGSQRAAQMIYVTDLGGRASVALTSMFNETTLKIHRKLLT